MHHCESCGREYDASGPWRCACGHPLDYADRALPEQDEPPDPASFDRDRGLWAFSDFLPVERRVSLGEGWTPLVETPTWDAQFKLDSVFPTGSFKDRGAAVTLSQADALGVDRVVEDSSGNAGLAIATYAARAGIDAEIYVPADAKETKLTKIDRTGADVVRVGGSREDVTRTCHDALGEDAWYASHAWQPAFFAGTMTWALEVAAQREWSVPDAVVAPVGHGTLLLGAYRGFDALRAAGWTDAMPRLLGAQASGYAPIAAGRERLTDGDSDERNEVAEGIQVRNPARGDQILDAIDATDGDAIAVGPAMTEQAHGELARAGFQVEPTCAAAVAALEQYRDRGTITPDDDVVLVLSGQNS